MRRKRTAPKGLFCRADNANAFFHPKDSRGFIVRYRTPRARALSGRRIRGRRVDLVGRTFRAGGKVFVHPAGPIPSIAPSAWKVCGNRLAWPASGGPPCCPDHGPLPDADVTAGYCSRRVVVSDLTQRIREQQRSVASGDVRIVVYAGRSQGKSAALRDLADAVAERMRLS